MLNRISRKTKTCTVCKEVKEDIKDFYSSKYTCKPCLRDVRHKKLAEDRGYLKEKFYVNRSRARRLGVVDTLTLEDLLYLYKLADGRCAYSGEKVGLRNLSIEHVIPLTNNGANSIDNVILVKLDINKSKHNNNVLTFLEKKFDKHKVKPLVKLLASRGNMEYEELYNKLFSFEKAESEKEYKKLLSKLNVKSA